MNRLIIEGVEADLKSDERIKLTRQVNDLREVKNKRTDFTNQFTLTYTPTNNKIFEHVRIYSSTSTTPYRYLDCQLLLNGYPVTIEGKIVLDKTDKRGYRVTVYAGLFNLFDELKNKKISELDLSEYSHQITLTEVTTRNTNKTDIFYPVYNDGYGQNGNILIQDKCPLIKNSYVVSTIMQSLGFSVNGSFTSTNTFLNTCSLLLNNNESEILPYNSTGNLETSSITGSSNFTQLYFPIHSEESSVSVNGLNTQLYDYDQTRKTIAGSVLSDYFKMPTYTLENSNKIRVYFDNVVLTHNVTSLSIVELSIGFYEISDFISIDINDDINVLRGSEISTYIGSTNSSSIIGKTQSGTNNGLVIISNTGVELNTGFDVEIVGNDYTINFPEFLDVEITSSNNMLIPIIFLDGASGNIGATQLTGDAIRTTKILLDTPEKTAYNPKILKDISQADYLKANLQLTNSFVSSIDYITKEVEITTLDSVSNNTYYNWTKKVAKKNQTLIKYETNKVGQDSYFKHDNEDNETIGENIINISNTRLDAEKDIIESDIKAVDQSSITLDSQSFTVDTIYAFEDKDEVNDNLIEEENLTGQDLIDHQNEYRTEVNTDDLFITYFEDQTGSITYEDQYGNTSNQSTFPKTNFTKLHWSELNDQYYQTWKEIFDEYKEVEMYFNLTLKDVIDFDFKRPVYLDTELGASLFYMNKISNYIEGKPTKCTLIKI